MLKKFAGELHEKDWSEVETDIEVKIIRTPLNHNESFVLCRSEGRRKKERAIIENHRKKLEAELTKVQTAIRKGRLKDVAKAAERIGRWRGKYTQAEKLFDVEFIKDNAGELINCI